MTLTSATDIQLARLRVRYAKTALPRFFSWWRGELVGLLPKRLRSLVDDRPEELLIETRPQQFGLWRLSNAGCADFGQVSRELPVEDQKAEFERLHSLVDDAQMRVYYCVPAERCLRREISMPAAAEDKLRQVLSFEMDRQTPFKADQVYFDYRVVERDEAAKSLRIQIVVVPRAQLDGELAMLNAAGVGLDGVDSWRDGPGSSRAGLNLLPQDRRVKRKNMRMRLNLALGAVAAILLFVAMWESLGNREISVQSMTVEVDKAQNDARQTSELAKRLEERTASANYLLQQKRDTTTMTELLADLTKRLPDDTFLERLTVDEKGKVDVQGQSSNAAKLIEGLQKSEVLVNPGFTGTIQSDPRTHKERFNMSFELRRSRDAAARKTAKPATNPHAEAGHAPDA
ncbi:MAG: PilN domain-containing protein [Rudaea sp.]